MSVRIRVNNFQSIEDAVVEVKGFTVITGNNNSGKSALVRAVRGAFQNSKGSSFVRYGKASAKVQVEFEDGHSVSWEKGKDVKPTYSIDGKDPIYPGQGIPEELQSLGMSAIQAGGRELWAQFAPQFDGQIFLLDQPGSVLAEAVADVTRVGQLNEALRGVESDRRASASELKVRQFDALRHRNRLEKFQGLDDLVDRVGEIEKMGEQASLILKAIEGLQGYLARLVKARQTISRLQWVETVKIVSDEEINALRNLRKDQEDLVNLKKRREQAIKDIKRYEGLDAVLPELDIEQAERILAAISLLKGLQKRRQNAETQIRSIELELQKAEQDLAEATKIFQDSLGNYSECPLCNSALGQHKHGGEVCEKASVS